ncbi:MAG: twin-arginine translocation signal domain-containing protein [Gammaproteobacteria bacterium]
MTQREKFDAFRRPELWLGNGLSRRSFITHATAAAVVAALPAAAWAAVDRSLFKRVPTQYIAALAPPNATSGDNAETWGLWRQDPGPRGVRLKNLDSLAGGVAPAGWHQDKNAWWLEEHGLLMETPDFPIPAGQYLVTGDREVTSVLTVRSASADGHQRWELADGATLYDVTHLRCRAALYTPAKAGGSCSPTAARPNDFPVAPGAAMPPVADCAKQDYQVLIVIGLPKSV